MTAEKGTTAVGWRVYGLGVMALALIALAFGDFDPGQPVPKDLPDRTVLAYAAAAFMLIAGAPSCGVGPRPGAPPRSPSILRSSSSS